MEFFYTENTQAINVTKAVNFIIDIRIRDYGLLIKRYEQLSSRSSV